VSAMEDDGRDQIDRRLGSSMSWPPKMKPPPAGCCSVRCSPCNRSDAPAVGGCVAGGVTGAGGAPLCAGPDRCSPTETAYVGLPQTSPPHWPCPEPLSPGPLAAARTNDPCDCTCAAPPA